MTQTRTVAGRRRPISTDRLLSILVISPSVVLIAVFVYSFLVRTAYVSLVAWNDLKPDYTWVGIRNYVRLFANQRFLIDLSNTLWFTVPFIIICLAVGLLLAALLDSKIKGESIFRAIFMFPLAVSFIVTGVAWRWLESPNSGINLLLGTVGFGWYTDPAVGILGVVIPATWQISGYVMAMYLAGLRGISEDLREAARIVRGRHVAPHVRALVVPRSQPVRLAAEREGLDRVFIDAGFDWRGAGCSMCLAMNPDKLEGREICASSSNRNFKGRQGSPTGRTLLMSPAMVAAAAVAGEIVDVREMADGD